jgi:thioredoxin 1
MRIHLATSLILLLTMPSCKKVKGLLATAKAVAPKPAASSSTAPASAPAVTMQRPADLTTLRGLPDFDEFIATKGPLMIAHFHWEDCQYSKGTCVVLDQLGSEFAGKVKIGRIDKDETPEVVRREKVDSFPRLRLYRDGKMLEEVQGFMVLGDMKALLEKHTKGIPETAVPPPPPVETNPGAAEPSIQPMKKDWRPPGVERR